MRRGEAAVVQSKKATKGDGRTFPTLFLHKLRFGRLGTLDLTQCEIARISRSLEQYTFLPVYIFITRVKAVDSRSLRLKDFGNSTITIPPTSHHPWLGSRSLKPLCKDITNPYTLLCLIHSHLTPCSQKPFTCPVCAYPSRINLDSDQGQAQQPGRGTAFVTAASALACAAYVANPTKASMRGSREKWG